MRLAAIAAGCAALAAASSPARGDRSTSVIVGVTGGARSTAASFGEASRGEVAVGGGARLTLSFDDPPLEPPSPRGAAIDVRLAPELLAGFLSDRARADGFAGAGLRGELWIASRKDSFRIRTAMYMAARALVIGDHQNGALELVIGEYLALGRATRFGWEGGAILRRRAGAAPTGSHELDAVVTIYLGWR